jgi:hypothetical protein
MREVVEVNHIFHPHVDELTDDMLNVLKSYVDGQSNECYKKNKSLFIKVNIFINVV